MISILLLQPAIFLVILLILKEKYSFRVFLFSTIISNILTALIVFNFDFNKGNFQLIEEYNFIKSLNIKLKFGIDGLSLSLIILTSILFLVVAFVSKNFNKLYYSLFLILQISLYSIFSSLDILLFYIFWDVVLVAMFFVILLYGSENRKYASIKFLLFTGIGSILMLFAFIFIYLEEGTFDLIALNNLNLTLPFFLLLLAFFIKMPIFPFHTWLPDAHVEAPTAGSVILAGLLLKLGSYGILRFNYFLFPEIFYTYSFSIAILSLVSAFYSAILTILQKDFKRLVAFSSIFHMSLILLGISTLQKDGIFGASFEMFSHGLISALGFSLAGYIKEIFKTREIESFKIYKNQSYLLFSIIILFLSLIGIPTLSSFPAEFLILKSSFEVFNLFTLLAIASLIIFSIGLIYILHKIAYFEKTKKFKDLKFEDFVPLLILIIISFVVGIYPNSLIKTFETIFTLSK